jgi:hypothetical protein
MTDLKVSHKDDQVVIDFMTWLKAQYGLIGELKFRRGKEREDLSMTLDSKVPEQVSINMSNYVEHMLGAFHAEELQSKSKTLGNENLFQVEKKSPMLEDEL